MRNFSWVVVIAGALPWAGCDFGRAYSEWCQKNGCSDAGLLDGFDAQAPDLDAAVGPGDGGIDGGIKVTTVILGSVTVHAGGSPASVPVTSLSPENAARTDLSWYVSAPPQTNPPNPPASSADAATYGWIDVEGSYHPPAQALSGCNKDSPWVGCPTLWAVSKDPSCVHVRTYDCWDYSWALLVPPE